VIEDQRVAASLEYLQQNFLGPLLGEDEVLNNRPDSTYLVGILYPQDTATNHASLDGNSNDEGLSDTNVFIEDEVIQTASEWRPSSAAISFIHSGDSVMCNLTFGTYLENRDAEDLKGPRSWGRSNETLEDISLGIDEFKEINTERFHISITSRWRRIGQNWLVTVGLTNKRLNKLSPEKPPAEDSIYQVAMCVSSVNGQILPYNSVSNLSFSQEDEELELRYRKKKSFAAGHGMSVTWDIETESAIPTKVSLAPMPHFTVPAIDPAGSNSPAMKLSILEKIPENKAEVVSELRNFIHGYSKWIEDEESKVSLLEPFHLPASERLIGRAVTARDRMLEGVLLLENDEDALQAFSLGMSAMKQQMLQSQRNRDSESEVKDPEWRPFQLGFILLCLSSQMNETHPDRSLVDLIWFPTGGGKTEAYLGLSAIEIFSRRLKWGVQGGGTAVLTRYTLRLLTTQQFQRAATLICAMELMRKSDPRVQGMQPFTIGLWVGNETTPGTYKEALLRFEATKKKAIPDNPFQLTACPWCSTQIMPKRRSDKSQDYGVTATKSGLSLRCPSSSCEFSDELPVLVVDEALFDSPPTILLSTVDKFARLPFEASAGRLLGRNSAFKPPTLIIQDELHLLSGPLGTTVALYEAAIQGILKSTGISPKIIASTATIRAASQQVLQLFDSPVALYPPSGIDQEDSFFAREATDRMGRTYIGIMPQAYSHSTSVVRSITPIMELPEYLSAAGVGNLDDYWTVVAYHNSLRELGRTVTLARDDVDSALKARAKNGQTGRSIRGDGLVELTSNIEADELPKALSRLEASVETGNAVDFVASTNMLSVGIDVSRLAIMLMNGQPKTTSEYIQATSRVGRGSVPGIVVTLLRSSRPRDRSHYEGFMTFHQSLYKSVEPTSVTPWSESSRRRSLAGVLVAYVRHISGWNQNNQAGSFDENSLFVSQIFDDLVARVERDDAEEAASLKKQLQMLLAEWASWSKKSSNGGEGLFYESQNDASLTKSFGARKIGWQVASSMRTVDRNVRIIAKGEEH
jgi:hypothetical protein